MPHLGKGSLWPPPYFLRRGIREDQFRIRPFQFHKFSVERIVFPIRDFGFGLIVIKPIMMGDLAA